MKRSLRSSFSISTPPVTLRPLYTYNLAADPKTNLHRHTHTPYHIGNEKKKTRS